MNVEGHVIPAMMLSLLIGSPILLFIGAIGNALDGKFKSRWGVAEFVSFASLYSCT